TQWSKVQPADGACDWSFFDQGITLAEKHDKRVGLSVAAGAATPEWVYRAGATRFTYRSQANFKEQAQAAMPLPWEKTFLDKWGAVIKSLGDRYDGSPRVAYVTIGGPGFAIESYFVRAKEDLPRVPDAGGTRRWGEGVKKIIDVYAEAFPTTPFLLAMAHPIPGKEGDAALREVVDHGLAKYPGRFGVMHHGLNAQSAARFYPNGVIQAQSGRTTVGFQ